MLRDLAEAVGRQGHRERRLKLPAVSKKRKFCCRFDVDRIPSFEPSPSARWRCHHQGYSRRYDRCIPSKAYDRYSQVAPRRPVPSSRRRLRSSVQPRTSQLQESRRHASQADSIDCRLCTALLPPFRPALCLPLNYHACSTRTEIFRFRTCPRNRSSSHSLARHTRRRCWT